MFRVRVSNHAHDRWKERVKIYWKKTKIAGYISTRFLPKLRQGIKPYVIENKSFYLFFTGEINEKLVFSVLTPDSSGLWSGWSVVTIITDDQIDSIDGYYDVLYQEVTGNERQSSGLEKIQGISKEKERVEKKRAGVDPISNADSKGGLMYLIFGFSYGQEEKPSGGINDLIGWSRNKEAAENFAEGQEQYYETIQIINVKEDIFDIFEHLEVI